MKRRIVAVVLATVLGAVCITGCGNTQETVESTVQVSTEAQTTQAAETAATESTEDADQAAADEVAAMIDAIYVQERTENTDKQCADAKAAWDAKPVQVSNSTTRFWTSASGRPAILRGRATLSTGMPNDQHHIQSNQQESNGLYR